MLTPTYLLTAAATPTPQQPSAFQIGSGSGNYPYVTGSAAIGPILCQEWNALNFTGQAGLCGYGVVAGIQIISTGGLNVSVTPGQAGVGQPLELVSFSTAKLPVYQAYVPSKTLQDASVNYVWLTTTGGLYANTTGIPVLGAVLLLGIVTCSGGNVTALDQSNRPTIAGGQLMRRTNDIGAPTDVLPQGMGMNTLTQTGVYKWQSAGGYGTHTYQAPPPNYQVITGTLTLSPLSAPTQYLVASGGNQTVLLPNPATVGVGWYTAIFNAGTSNNVAVKDYTNTTTYVTLSPGQASSGATTYVSGSVAFPASWVGGAPSGGIPIVPA